MIKYTQGNLLESSAEALVNTVNTVGVMGKGIALMFKERFPENMAQYASACKAKQMQTGKVFVTKTNDLVNPKWIINFPTKQHWRNRSKMEWVVDGLQDLKHFITENQISSIAIPPLGAGNGGLPWPKVREQIELSLSGLNDVEILIYEPNTQYQNTPKKTGVEKLTPARALISELIRRYWLLGIECSILEIQKLAWFLQRVIESQTIQNPLTLKFEANNYGPYADALRHVLDALDGSYLQSEKRIADCGPSDVVFFDYEKKSAIQSFLNEQAQEYLPALEATSEMIEGFESPYGLELLATVDWLLHRQQCEPTIPTIQVGIAHWPAGPQWARRKAKIFDQQDIGVALDRLAKIGI